jgi:hypothetical protein
MNDGSRRSRGTRNWFGKRRRRGQHAAGQCGVRQPVARQRDRAGECGEFRRSVASGFDAARTPDRRCAGGPPPCRRSSPADRQDGNSSDRTEQGEALRGALSRYITHKFSGGQNIIPAYLISKEIEDAVRGAVRQTSGASYLALSPDLHRQLITAMKNVISNVAPHSLPPVILAPMDIRRFMRKLIERDFPDLAVLSYQELDPGANVQPLERIKFVTQLSAA